eukprot:scaffold2742_cov130-Isochrysis_galbana.AAC.16
MWGHACACAPSRVCADPGVAAVGGRHDRRGPEARRPGLKLHVSVASARPCMADACVRVHDA